MTLRIPIRKFSCGLFLATAFLAVGTSRAAIPEPDAVIYGQLYHRFDESLIPTQSGQIVVIAQVNGTTLATNLIPPGAHAFLLRLPMDDGLDPRQPNTAKGGDQVHFFIRNNQTRIQFECLQSPILSADRGPVVSLDLAVEGNLIGVAPDSNGNGIPDYLENHFHFNPAGVTPPVATITAPFAGQRWSNAVFTVTGQVNGGPLARVWYQVNGTDWLPASTANGYTDWSANLMLTAGTNSIKAFAVDTTGNCSPINGTTLFYVVTKRLIVSTSGQGTLSTNYNNKNLEVGRSYSITATPGVGYVFTNWMGGVNSATAVMTQSPKITFLMQSNLVLKANFIPSPFVLAKGTYNGLYYDSNDVQMASSGFFTLTLTDKGAYTGSLQSGANKYSLSGQFYADGTDVRTVGPATDPMTLNLALDLADGTRLTGSVSKTSWLAELRADRPVFDAVTNPATGYAGQYTVIVPGAEASDIYPEGDGYATATVDQSGMVKMSGSLADGVAIAQTVPVSRDGQWPLYVSLYGGKGSVLGWMTFANSPNDLSGWLRWINPAQTKAKVYRAGFTNAIPEVAGSRYVSVSSTSNALNLVNGQLIFEGGNLGVAFTNEVTLMAGKVINHSSNKLTMKITNTGGTFSGSVTVPGLAQSYSFKGAVLTNRNIGSGYFLGTNQSGRVYFAPQ